MSDPRVEWDSIRIDGITLPGNFRMDPGPIPLGCTSGPYTAEFQVTIEAPEYRKLIRSLGPSKPRWGLRGRNRKRKTRIAARAHNAIVQRVKREVEEIITKLLDQPVAVNGCGFVL